MSSVEPPMKRILVWVVFVLLSSFSVNAYSQGVGSISGSITDSTGATVPGAQITVTNQGTNIERMAVADSSGYFSVTLLPIGTYSVRVSHEGFDPSVLKDIVLEGQQNVRLEFKLAVGSVTQSVEVTAANASTEVQRVDATLGQTVHAEQVENLPLNGRNFVQLAQLTPGTTKSDNPSDFLNAGTSSEVSFRGSVSLSVQGMPESANDWRYDGVDDNELTAGGVGFLPQIDAIQEFNVLTYNYSAQYGSRGGSTVLVSSKSGTNHFHGSLFEFIRNDYLDARNYFDPVKKGKYIQNQFGGSLGGPVWKDKTFFFLDYEGNRVRQGAPILSTIPTDAQSQQHIFTNPIFNPFPFGSGTRTSYYNSALSAYQIPASQISSIGQSILNLLPRGAPVPGTNGFPTGFNYTASPTRSLNDDEWDARVDHQFGPKDRLFARFSWDNASQFNPSGLPGLGSRSAFTSTTYFTVHARNMVLSETHVFSAHIVNQVTAGYNKDFNYIRGLGYGTNVAQQLGITGANLGDVTTSGMTLISMTGFNPVGDRNYSPYQGGTSIFHYSDALSVVKGSHSMVFGFDFRPEQLNGLGESYFHGQMGFTKNFTAQVATGGTFPATITDNGITGANGNPIASVLLGLPDNGNRSNQVNSGIIGRRWKEYRGYAQDNWAVTPNLTLNMGLAYGVTTPTSEAKNRISNFDVDTGNFFVAGNVIAPSATVLVADKYAGIHTDNSNLEPRFAFSYSPFGVKKNSVIRGGYAIFHDVSHLGVSNGIHQNPPYTNTFTFQSNDLDPTINNGRVLIPGASNNGFPDNSAPQNPATYAGSLVAQQRNFKQGIVQQYNVNVQTATPDGTLFTLAYAGTHATRMLNSTSNYNSAPPGTGNNTASRRMYPQYQTINYILGNGWLIYNSLQAKVEHRTRDFYLLGAYTYSQGINNGFVEGVSAGAGAPYFPFTTRLNIPVSGRTTPLNSLDDRGNSSLTLRNAFTASAIYVLPFGRGKRYLTDTSRWVDEVIGNWQVNTIVTSHSGYPLSFTQATNTSGAGITNRPDIVPNCDLYAGAKKVTKWFNTACFATPTAQQFGNAGRTYGYGPGRTNVDLSFYKKFPIVESHEVEFRAEFFNILNHSQFSTPDIGWGDAAFGAISATVHENRQIQFALKYRF
jgi:Carboxypeptidase regulatory-like domain